MSGISIRAPARGATLLHAGTAYQWCISIRAPARGATITSNRSVRLIRISIRAPARGATCTFTHILSIRQFQSALPRGERRRADDRGRRNIIFQSALPRGERLVPGVEKLIAELISIRAPARGATLLQFVYCTGKRNFNPRSREGSDAAVPSNPVHLRNFNPRSREGSDNNFHQKVLFSLSKNCLIHLFFITNFLN